MSVIQGGQFKKKEQNSQKKGKSFRYKNIEKNFISQKKKRLSGLMKTNYYWMILLDIIVVDKMKRHRERVLIVGGRQS